MHSYPYYVSAYRRCVLKYIIQTFPHPFLQFLLQEWFHDAKDVAEDGWLMDDADPFKSHREGLLQPNSQYIVHTRRVLQKCHHTLISITFLVKISHFQPAKCLTLCNCDTAIKGVMH